MDKSEYEAMTVLDLRDELSSRGLAVYGSKAELVERLVEHDDDESDDPPGDTRVSPESKRRELRGAGVILYADPVPETPAEIVTCSVCGTPDGECVHARDPQPGPVPDPSNG